MRPRRFALTILAAVLLLSGGCVCDDEPRERSGFRDKAQENEYWDARGRAQGDHRARGDDAEFLEGRERDQEKLKQDLERRPPPG